MSLPMNTESHCYVCGKTSEQMTLLSTNQFGSPDLDLRPPGMARSTMSYWIQECPYCGYVAKELSDETVITKDWLSSNTYISCDNRKFIHRLAELFYRHYLISVENNDNESAFYAALHSAWVCDDAYDVDNAIFCRKKALLELEKMIVNDSQNEKLLLMRADLLRRSGQFELLIKEYENKKFSEKLFNEIAMFQIRKAKQKDTHCYRIADVQIKK